MKILISGGIVSPTNSVPEDQSFLGRRNISPTAVVAREI